MREFESGAIREDDAGKIDPEGALSPEVLAAFCRYMEMHCTMPDGTTRSSDNWQKGFPQDELMKSLLRHVLDLWLMHRGGKTWRDDERVSWFDAFGGAFFNLQALWLAKMQETK